MGVEIIYSVNVLSDRGNPYRVTSVLLKMRSFWTWWINRQKYRGKQQPIASNRVFLLILPLMCVCVCIFFFKQI